MGKIKKLFTSAASRNGSYSVGMIALVICIVIVINLIAGQMPETVKSIDISDNKIYEITDTSREMLADLDENVTFTIFAEKDSADDRIETFVQKYAALSDRISVEWVDPVLHPARLTESEAEENDILIACEETQKSTIVSFDDILVTDEYSYWTTGSSSPTEFDGEGQLTSAINYVTSDTKKKIYCTTGHGESSFSSSVTDLLDKNNMSQEEVNLIMDNAIPEDCDLLFLYAPTSDISEDEKEMMLSYLAEGGKIFVLLGEMEGDAPNLDAILSEYGIERVDGYIADIQRCYQGNYYYIFPEITASGELADGLSSDMILLGNAHGMNLTEAARDTISVSDFMTTSSEAYAVTEESQEQGTYVLGAVARETISVEEDTEAASEESDINEESDSSEEAKSEESDSSEETESEEEETVESRLTVISTESLIDSQITDSFASLENLKLFINAVSSNFEDIQNVAIEAKSLSVTYNAMQHTGLISLLMIFGIPAAILIYGFVQWWKRRRA